MQKKHKREIAFYNGISQLYHTLNLQKVNENESELQRGMEAIKEARAQLMENKFDCITCKDINKNTYFIDGCNHITLYEECAKKLDYKKCPICSVKYTRSKKIFI